jgi:uncharacterized OsmC-like protein
MSLVTIQREKDGSVVVRSRNQEIPCDWSIEDGGRGQAMSPTEILVASVGACVVMVVGNYCDRNGYKAGGVEVSLTYEMSSSPSRIATILMDLEIPADVPDERKKIIRKLAESCPIHRTLISPPKIDIEII